MCGGVRSMPPARLRGVTGADGRRDAWRVDTRELRALADTASRLRKVLVNIGAQGFERRHVHNANLVGERRLEPPREEDRRWRSGRRRESCRTPSERQSACAAAHEWRSNRAPGPASGRQAFRGTIAIRTEKRGQGSRRRLRASGYKETSNDEGRLYWISGRLPWVNRPAGEELAGSQQTTASAGARLWRAPACLPRQPGRCRQRPR